MAQSRLYCLYDNIGMIDMSEKARKQRKRLEQAPNHKRRKIMSATLSGKLREKYGIRSFPVVKGDEVEVMRGGFKGHEDKVAEVDRRRYRLFIEGVTTQKADEAKEPLGIHPSNVRIVKLNLSDPWRKKKIQSLSKEG